MWVFLNFYVVLTLSFATDICLGLAAKLGLLTFSYIMKVSKPNFGYIMKVIAYHNIYFH